MGEVPETTDRKRVPAESAVRVAEPFPLIGIARAQGESTPPHQVAPFADSCLG
jgi:hypothetical protein